MAFVKGEHPRLYFSRDDLARLRERSKIGVSAEILAILTAFCDRMVDPKDEHYFNVRKQKKPLERGIVEASLVYLSLAYAFTGEKCYGEAARDAVVGMIRGKLAEDFRHGLRGSMHAIQDKGWYALAICTAYDVCYDLFDDEQRKLFIIVGKRNHDRFAQTRARNESDRPLEGFAYLRRLACLLRARHEARRYIAWSLTCAECRLRSLPGWASAERRPAPCFQASASDRPCRWQTTGAVP